MSGEYLELFRQSRRGRILEQRSQVLAQFLREHNLSEPKSVEYAPLLGCEFSRCFVNVDRQIARAGGTMETGWIFQEVEDTSVSTIAHAIWITPQGRRRDITPQQLAPARRILFLPDAGVAAKRGVTTGCNTILSADPRVIRLEKYRMEMSRIIEEVFPGFGFEYVMPVERLRDAGEKIGLPSDVVDGLIQQRMKQNREDMARYGI